MLGKLRAIPVEVRAHIYRVLVALVPILVAVGVVASEDAQLYLNLAAALLGLGGGVLAAVNTPTGKYRG